MDDRDRFAMIDTLTVENGTTLTTPVETIRYQYSNHLGSACLELDSSAAIISYEEYHPFGTTSYRSGRNEVDVSLKRYKYVGKERDEETGLYYYGARYYAGWLGRWTSTDPLKEKYLSLSPYNYCANNPVKYIDPDGNRVDDYFDKSGKFLYSDKNKSNSIIIVDDEGNKSLLSENTLTPRALRNIGQHYASQVDEIKNNVNIWGSRGTGSIMRVETYDNATHLSIMITQASILQTNSGQTSYLIDNYNNFKSCLVHEWWHLDKQYAKISGIWVKTEPFDPNVRELDAYSFEISHEAWQNTTRDYQMQTISNIGKYIYKISDSQLKEEKLNYFEEKLKITFTNLSDKPKEVNWKLNF